MDESQQPTAHLGALIRSRRRELGLTQAELAARVDKSPSYISSLESGSVAPSLMALRHIALALETVVGYFFEPPENGQSRFEPASGGRLRVVRPATRKVLIDPTRGDVRWELLSPDLQRQMEVVHMTLAAGAVVGEEEWLIHEGEECGIVVSGALVIEFEHESFTLESGDSLYFPSTRPHRIRNRADGPTTAIWVITPPSF
jgi:mannose-6-phosphate isomerase-like protein (cupin superfamily)/DNA-binding XRE family transcriptional regulator